MTREIARVLLAFGVVLLHLRGLGAGSLECGIAGLVEIPPVRGCQASPWKLPVDSQWRRPAVDVQSTQPLVVLPRPVLDALPIAKSSASG